MVARRIFGSKMMSIMSLVIGLLLALAVMIVIVLHTDFFAGRISSMASRYLFRGTEFSMKIGGVFGNPLSNFGASDIRIRYSGRDYSFDVVRIERIECRYDIRSLLSDSPVIEEIVIEKPHVWIKPDSTGTNIVPQSGKSGSGEFPLFEVESFRMTEGQIIVQGRGRAKAARNINLEGSVRSDRGGIMASISGGNGEYINRGISIRSIIGDVRWMTRAREDGESLPQANVLRMDSLELDLDESSIILSGTVEPASMLMDLAVSASPLDVEEMTGILEVGTSLSGEIQGDLRLSGKPDTLRVTGELSGILSGYALDDLMIDVRRRKSSMEFGKVYGRINGSLVNGSASYSSKDPHSFTAEFETSDLDLSVALIGREGVPPTMFNGSAYVSWTKGSGLDFDLDLSGGHLRNIPFENARITGSYRADTLWLDRLDMADGTHMIESHGAVHNGRGIKLYFDLRAARDDMLFSYFRIDEYRADLELNGVWEGAFDDWVLHGSGICRDLVYKGIHVDSAGIKLALDGPKDYDLSLDLEGDSCRIGSLAFSNPMLSLRYNDRTTSLKRIHVDRNDMKADLIVDVKALQDRTDFVFNEVLIHAFDEKWTGSGRFLISLKGPVVEFEDLQLHSRVGAFFLDGLVDRDARKIEGTASFDRLDLSFLGSAGLTGLSVGGRSRGKVRLTGSLDDPGLEIDIAAGSAVIDSVAIDSVGLKAAYSPGQFDIERLSVHSPGGSLELEGTLSGSSLEKIYREKMKAMEGVTVGLSMECSDLSLEPFLGYAGKIPFSGGAFTGDVVMTDSLSHPHVSVKGRFIGLSSDLFRFPGIEVSAGIDGEVISFEGSIDISGGEPGRFSGAVPLARKRWFYGIEDDGGLSVRLELPGGDLSGIVQIAELLAEGNGKYSAEAEISGTVRDPVIRGRLGLDNAMFRLSGMEERFHEVEAEILLEDTLITVARLRGGEGKNGRFSCEGTITLKGWRPEKYDLKAAADKVLVASIPDIMAIVSGNLAVVTREQDGKKIPMMTGAFDVNRAEIYLDIGDFSSSGTAGTMEPPSWMAEIDLGVRGNAWIKTSDANVEMQGDITLHHDNRGTYLRGILNLLRGWYNVYNNKFRVTSGKLAFVHAGGFRPVVDIEAETLDPEGRTIYLTLSWHEDEIEPKLSLRHEDPGYNETDIWKMLGGGVIGSTVGEGASWDAVNTAQNLAANYIEKMLNSQMQGITIELETSGGSGSQNGAGEPKETTVAIGKYLSEGLYVKYKQGLSISTARHFEAEYRISNLFLIRSEIIKYSEKVLQGRSQRSSDEFNVDLKLRWEF